MYVARNGSAVSSFVYHCFNLLEVQRFVSENRYRLQILFSDIIGSALCALSFSELWWILRMEQVLLEVTGNMTIICDVSGNLFSILGCHPTLMCVSLCIVSLCFYIAVGYLSAL